MTTEFKAACKILSLMKTLENHTLTLSKDSSNYSNPSILTIKTSKHSLQMFMMASSLTTT